MRKFRKKQKSLYGKMKILIIFSAIFIFIFIGAKPYLMDFNTTLALVLNYVCDFLVIAVMCVVFIYYSKYSKSDSFLNVIEHEISDAGYYFTSRTEKEISSYIDVVCDDLKSTNFSVDRNIEIDELDFDARAMKKREFFYIFATENPDKNDVLAYLDSVITDITIHNLKRRGDAVLCFVCNKADDSAVALSKMITPLGKKEQIKIAVAIAELSTGRVYFLGNMQTKCQQLIANYVMNCEVPVKDKYIGKERLSFQDELEERMKDFNIKDFKDGNFYAH